MRVVCISDTHNQHGLLSPLPDADAVIHAGDATDYGMLPEIEAFLAWFSALPHAAKMFVPGNHDGPAFEYPRIRASLKKKYPQVQILIDKEIWYKGMRIYGAPWLPALYTEIDHFFISATSQVLEEKWAAIPDDTSLLITHGPPFRILDRNESGQYIGDPVLLDRIDRLPKFRAHVFGHVHKSSGALERAARLHINAAICDEANRATKQPVLFEIGEAGASLVDLD